MGDKPEKNPNLSQKAGGTNLLIKFKRRGNSQREKTVQEGGRTTANLKLGKLKKKRSQFKYKKTEKNGLIQKKKGQLPQSQTKRENKNQRTENGSKGPGIPKRKKIIEREGKNTKKSGYYKSKGLRMRGARSSGVKLGRRWRMGSDPICCSDKRWGGSHKRTRSENVGKKNK